MTARVFSSDEGRKALTDSVVRAEACTSAEVVIAVRRHASAYLRTSLAFAAALTLLLFAYLMLASTVYDVRLMPLELALGFGLGVLVCHSIDPLRFRLTPTRVLREALDRASREAFDSLGVKATRGRTGVLVYVGLFEREARLVPDEGLAFDALGEPLAAVRASLDRAVARRDLPAFTEAVAELGRVLGALHPRSEDDENELCDAPH